MYNIWSVFVVFVSTGIFLKNIVLQIKIKHTV